MQTGMLHLHVTVVTLFLLFLLFKAILLLANKNQLLDKIRSKTKMVDIILGVLILVTGGYLMTLFDSIPTYLIVKVILVLLAIPLGIVGLKKSNKGLTLLSLLLIIYVYGVAETGSLTFKKDSDYLKEEPQQTEQTNPTDKILESNSQNMQATGKTIYTHECVKCHGTDGKKKLFNAPDLSTSKLTLEQREAMIKEGKGTMPGFGNRFSDTQIQAVASYLDNLKEQP